MEQAFQDWDTKDKIFQRELNIHVCRKWDELITEGKHGHYECHQLLFSLPGIIEVNIKAPEFEKTVLLQPNGKALYIPPKHWASQTFANGDEILGCLASHSYDADDIYVNIS
jgi:hypothetical protein